MTANIGNACNQMSIGSNPIVGSNKLIQNSSGGIGC